MFNKISCLEVCVGGWAGVMMLNDETCMCVCVCRNCDKPRLIEALKTKRIRDIACGSSHSAAITSSGELYSWGLGEYGRLGHGDNTTQLRPKLVSTGRYSCLTVWLLIVPMVKLIYSACRPGEGVAGSSCYPGGLWES